MDEFGNGVPVAWMLTRDELAVTIALALTKVKEAMEEEFPGFAKVVSFGNSSEGREILGIRITNEGHVHPHTTEEEEEKEEEEGLRSQKHKKKGKKGKKALPHKLGFVVVGASHAREVRVRTHRE